MRILAISDIVDPILDDHFNAEWWANQHINLIISCGDLPADYLSFLVSAFNVPLFYVPGNHDGNYRESPPEGCDSIDGRLVHWGGLHVAGLGGSLRYNTGAEQYTDWQMRLRALRLAPAIWQAGRLDLVVTHAPPRFDLLEADEPITAAASAGQSIVGPDHVHQGFSAFTQLIQAHHPRYLLHGHTHLSYGRARRIITLDRTQVIDVYGHYILDL